MQGPFQAKKDNCLIILQGGYYGADLPMCSPLECVVQCTKIWHILAYFLLLHRFIVLDTFRGSLDKGRGLKCDKKHQHFGTFCWLKASHRTIGVKS